MKQAVLDLMRIAGAFAPFRILYRNKALILTYHRFEREGSQFATSARAFLEQLQYLRSRYRIVSLSEMAESFSDRRKPVRALAAITIDDGYRDAYEIAFPILRKHGIPATLFVVTDFVEERLWLWTDKLRFLILQTNEKSIQLNIADRSFSFELNGKIARLKAADRLNSVLKKLSEEHRGEIIMRVAQSLEVNLPKLPPTQFAAASWNQLREMEANRIEIGSHTITHPILTLLSPERLRREVVESRAHLESELGHDVHLFCYPNGDWNDNVRTEVVHAGYRCAVTTDVGLNDFRSDLFELKRIHTERDLSHFVQSTSGLEQLKVKLLHSSQFNS